MGKVRTLLAALLLPLVALTAIATVVLWPDQRKHEAPASLGIAVPLVEGTVTRVDSAPCPDDPSQAVCDTLTFELTNGPDKGQTATAPTQQTVGVPKFAVNDKIVLGRTEVEGGAATYYVSDFQRKAEVGWLAAAFALVIVLIGRWRGVGALIGLAFTWVVVANFLLPSMLEGKSPVLLAVTAAALIVFVVLYVAHGFNTRTTTALIGTLIGLGLTGLLASVAVAFAHITGLSSEDVTSVQSYAGQISVKGLLLAGIVIGSLGVLNDVTVTQASAVWEVRRADPTMSRFNLYRSGMRVGRDHIASTVYTLALAYVGAALPLLIIFAIANRTWSDAVGTDVVSEEIVRTVAGGIGLVLAMPITTALAAFVAGGDQRNAEPTPVVDATTPMVPVAPAANKAREHEQLDEPTTGSHFAIDAGAIDAGAIDVDGLEIENAEPRSIRTNNETIAVPKEEDTGQINLAAFPPEPEKKRFGSMRRSSEFNRKMSRRERKFWGDEAE